MTSDMQIIDRTQLGFNLAVKDAFEYLIERGFKCTAEEPTLVRFEAHWCWVNIFHGRKSYEIGLEMGPVGLKSEKQSFPFSVLLAALFPDEYARYKCYATHSKEGVLQGVSQLASLFKKCINSELFSESEIFHILNQKSEELIKEFSIEVRLQQARRQLEIAWHDKNFERVIELLTPIQKHLSDVEISKLRYAEKHK